MSAGRPRQVDPGALYALAHQFYWDFRGLDEGSFRSLYDKKRYKELAAQAENVQLSDEQRLRARQVAEEEIQGGRLKESRREERVREIEELQLSMTRDLFRRTDAVEGSRKQLRIPGEPDTVKVLLDPNTTPEQVRELCKDAFMTRRLEVQPGVYKEVEVFAWPISVASSLPTYLSQYAEQFVAALRDPRFPCCDVATRPSTRLKQLWFLARALAGALFGVKTRTAINLVGSMRPEEIFHESRNGKPARRRRRKRIATRRH